MLFDLENNTLADPFTDKALHPDVAIVTAADFAPDGKSLICSVFGDGGIWIMNSFNEFALYQIRLDDGSFDAVRILETDTFGAPPSMFSWLENNSLWIKASWASNPLSMPKVLALQDIYKNEIG